MSRRNENVSNDIWDDEPFADLSAPAKLTYFWSFTNSACGMSGVYKVRLQQIALHTALTRGAVEQALAELEAARMLFYRDGVVWVRARVRRLVTQTPQIAKSIARDIAALDPEHPLRVAFLRRYWDTKWPGEQLRAKLGSAPEATVNRGSGDPQISPDSVGQSLTLTRGSGDPPLPVPLLLPVSEATSEEPTAAVARDAEPRPEDVVWAHYLERFYAGARGTRPSFDPTRRSVVRNALRRRPLEIVLAAVDGLAASDFHNARREHAGRKRYTDISYALRARKGSGLSDEARIDEMAAAARPIGTTGAPANAGAANRFAQLRPRTGGEA